MAKENMSIIASAFRSSEKSALSHHSCTACSVVAEADCLLLPYVFCVPNKQCSWHFNRSIKAYN